MDIIKICPLRQLKKNIFYLINEIFRVHLDDSM